MRDTDSSKSTDNFLIPFCIMFNAGNFSLFLFMYCTNAINPHFVKPMPGYSKNR